MICRLGEGSRREGRIVVSRKVFCLVQTLAKEESGEKMIRKREN
jgi:hypothetical protein